MSSGISMAKPSFVFLAAVGYDHCLSGRTRRLADILAGMGHDVTFVEMPSVRAMAARLSQLGHARRPAGNVRVIRVAPFPAFLRLSQTPLAKAWVRWTQRQLARQIPNINESILVV